MSYTHSTVHRVNRLLVVFFFGVCVFLFSYDFFDINVNDFPSSRQNISRYGVLKYRCIGHACAAASYTFVSFRAGVWPPQVLFRWVPVEKRSGIWNVMRRCTEQFACYRAACFAQCLLCSRATTYDSLLSKSLAGSHVVLCFACSLYTAVCTASRNSWLYHAQKRCLGENLFIFMAEVSESVVRCEGA